MCGRFTLSVNVEDVAALLPDFLFDGPYQPRYNIAPSQAILTALNDNGRKFTYTHWGLIPSWCKGPGIWKPLINARAESLTEKPSFKACVKNKRCLIPANGFYEWKGTRGKKQPLYFQLKSERIFAFAGLWDEWQDKEGGVTVSSTIITTSPNALVRKVHSRMPVIIKPEYYSLWLSGELIKADQLSEILAPYDPDKMQMTPVSDKVNSTHYDKPDCITPAGQQAFNFQV